MSFSAPFFSGSSLTSEKSALLRSLVVLTTFVALCNAQCYVIPRENTPGNLSNECRDLNGVTHPLNSRWKTKNCQECECGQDGIACCSMVAAPNGYDPVKCQKIFIKETCTYKVVERTNPGRECFVSGWIL
ncbi:beta-microseminoprotein isoform X1 [Manis javanica]|uniref:beta-microseminoprotein isoform X1 n=1 Tax=Manis javanica TaxID=9974 RepID=UPI000812FB28|nr:beta-microseminoprotein isoform X1 [Manis javanica]